MTLLIYFFCLNARIYKSISDQVMRNGPTFQQLFNWAYNYRLAAMRRGESTPILNFLVYRKIRKILGGHVRLMFSGGAPLSPETNDFIRVCMNAPLLQGYGLTETNACATLTEIDMVLLQLR
jgi:long-chain acyl-CoA synthetase